MTFKQLTDYFTAAGYQLEGFRASVYRVLAGLNERGGYSQDEGSEIAFPSADGSLQQSLIQIGLEFKTILENINAKGDQIPAVIRLLDEVAAFEKRLPQIHRVIRRHSSAVDFANPKLTIRGFGRMQVRLGNRIVTGKDWKTQVVRDLFFYLLSHPEGVTKEEIGAAFWPDADRDTVKLRFKNSIYRLRRAVGKDSVSFDDDIYRFNRSIDYDYDVDTFVLELENAKKAQGVEEEIEHYRAALASYRGSLLPKIDQDWVLVAREQYHEAFMTAALNLINLYLKSGRYSQAAALANQALEEDNYNEAMYRSAMMAYSAMEDRPAVARQFERCKLVLKKELDLEPSPQTVKLYNSLMRQ